MYKNCEIFGPLFLVLGKHDKLISGQKHTPLNVKGQFPSETYLVPKIFKNFKVNFFKEILKNKAIT